MAYIFWIGVGLLAHTYFLYPLSLAALGRLAPRRWRSGDPNRYRVTMVIAAYNEEQIIAEKIRNAFELEFPREKLEILIGSDASTDRTHEIVSAFAPDVRLVVCNPRGGKSAVLNQLVPQARGDILVFCDANTMLLKNALQKLLAPFEDPRVGCVCGRLILHDAGESSLGMGEAIYWNLESEIKKMEGWLGVVIGANGGIYAIRKELFRRIPVGRTAMDDFFVTTRVLAAGKAAIYEPQAIGSEETSAAEFGEFHRKVRISQANFNLLGAYLPLLNPRLGWVAYGFFSHKLLRWVAPIILLALFASNLALFPRGGFFAAAFALQAAFYLLALFGYFRNTGRKKPKLLLIPFYFVSMNLALLLGMLKACFPSRGGMWKRIERSQVRANSAL